MTDTDVQSIFYALQPKIDAWVDELVATIPALQLEEAINQYNNYGLERCNGDGEPLPESDLEPMALMRVLLSLYTGDRAFFAVSP